MKKICKHCGETFKAARRDSEYCGTSCRNKAYYDRRVTADPLYSQKVNEKRQLSIQKEIAELEKRSQERRERIRKENEQRALEIEESRKLAIQQEQERRELEAYNQRIKEKEEAERHAEAKAEAERINAAREMRKQREKEKEVENMKKLANALNSLFGR